jgi:hypothetical protein
MPSSNSDTGPKIGWIGGFLGASLWLLILSAVRLANQDLRGGLLGLVLYFACLGCIFGLRPWKFPHTRLWKLYTATLAPLLVAAGLFYWREMPLDLSLSGLFSVVSLLTVLFLPVFLHGRKTWAGLQGS